VGRRRATFLRFLAIFLVLLLLGTGALTLLVRHYFPPEEVARLLSDVLTDKTGYSVRISRIHFNLLRGFEIDNLCLRADRTHRKAPLDSVHVAQVTLRYSFWQLLHRILRVHTVEVDAPHAWLSLQPTQQPDTVRVDTSPETSRARSKLPVSVDLKRLSIRNFGITARLHQPQRVAELQTAGWNLELSGLNLKRTNSSLKFQHLSVQHPAGNLRVRVAADTFQISASLTTKVDFSLAGNYLPDSGRVSLSLLIRSDTLRILSPHRRLRVRNLPTLVALNTNGFLKVPLSQPVDSPRVRVSTPTFHVGFPTLTLRLLGSSLFNGHLSVRADSGGHDVSLSLGEASFPLNAWVHVLYQALPELATPLDSASLKNTALRLSFVELRGHGKKSPTESVSASLAGLVTAPRLFHPASQTAVESLRTDFDLAGSAVNSRLRKLDVHALALASGVATQTGTRFVSLNNVTLEVGATLDSTLWLHTADLDFEIDDALGGTAFVRSHWFTPGKRASLRGELQSRLRGLQIANLTDQPLHGRLDFHSVVRVPGDGSVQATASWLADSLVLETPEQPIAFPPLRGQFKGRGLFNPETRYTSLRNWQLWLPGFLVAQGDLRVLRDSVHVVLHRFRTQPGKIVDWARPLLPETSSDIVLGGTVGGAADLRFSRRQSALAGSLYVTDGLFAKPSSEFAAGQIRFSARFSGAFDSLGVNGTGRLDSLWLGSFGRRPLRGTTFRVIATVLPELALIRLDTVTAQHTPLGLFASGHGEISSATPDTQVVKLDYVFHVSADSFGPLGDVAQLRGVAAGDGRVRMFGDLLQVQGTIRPRSLCARLASGVELDTVAGKVSYDFWFDLSGEEPVFLADSPDEFPNSLREIQYASRRWLTPPGDTLYVRHIRFLRYRLESLRADVLARNGFVYVPFFRVNAYGGAVGGHLLLNYQNRTSLTGAFAADIQISRLNTALLNPARRRKNSYVTGTIRLRGQGFTPESLTNVRGLVQFTELGPTVADDILASLDPSGLNPGIRNTRRLLALGFRPLQMSFQLRQGYFYPSLKLKQPWFSPVRLSGGRIDMGRLPLEPFLRTAQAGGLSP